MCAIQLAVLDRSSQLNARKFNSRPLARCILFNPYPQGVASMAEEKRTFLIEQRSVDFVPENERHGSVFSLFTLWFSANMQITTVVTGALAVVLGLPLLWAIVAIILGNALGGIFMALHSAQGPRMGIPQMIQSRAQFGFYGAILPLILVIILYIGFFASSGVLGGQALSAWTGLPVTLSILII